MDVEENVDFDTSCLFASITSDIPEEQWEYYKQQIKFGKYVIDDSDDDSYASDGSVSHVDEEFVTNVELVEEEEEKENEASENEDDQISWGCDAADKYAQGKITFSELNGILEDRAPTKRPRKKRRLDQEETFSIQEDQLEEVEDGDFEPKGKKRKSRRRKCQLPKHLEGLMGEANSAYAHGDTEKAIQICMELIREAPYANEPFQTLGVIYDQMGESRKAFQCYLVSAFLNPTNTEEWIRLAEQSLEQNEMRQAITCFTQAINNEPDNINLLWERCNLYEQINERKKALTGYELIMRHLSDPDEGEKCVDMAKLIAKVHHENKDFVNAGKVLETAFIKFPSLVTSEDVNWLLELQLNQKFYKSAVKTFVQHCGVVLTMPAGYISTLEDVNDLDDQSFTEIVSCTVPEVLPIDLSVKFLVCLIHLKSQNAYQPLLDSLLKESPNDIGDLFLDVGEALMEESELHLAKPFLEVLLSTPAYDLAAVWKTYADCLYGLNDIEKSIDAYKRVIALDPTCQDARLALSKIFLKMGKVEEATDILKQDYESGQEGTVLGTEALYERCKLLEAEGRMDEYIAAGTLLQYSHCQVLETEDEYNIVISNQTCRRRIQALTELKAQTMKHDVEFEGPSIPVEELWSMFCKISRKLMEQKRYAELQNISLASLSSSLFMKNPQWARDLEFQALLSCFYNNAYNYTYTLARDLVIKNLHSNKAWNLFCLIVIRSQENRHNRFCIRLMMKHQDHLALGFLNGHNAMISGTYKHALGEYMCIYKEHPNDPYAVFCVGIIFIHMACQKFASKRHLLSVQGFAFLTKYLKLKGECQETFYNIGRALHQLGVKDLALHYYKKALCAPLRITGPEKDIFDLQREIAYNMCLIYQSTGAMDLVYYYSRKYITV